MLEEGVTAIAVSFLHAYHNPEHERQAAELIRREFPGVFVSASSEVWPQQREYERTLATVMNAYVGSRMSEYFQRLEAGASEQGLRAQVLSTMSNGGIMTARRAAQEPVKTLLSGPASGVIGATHVARLAGIDKVITFDMGGTSVDVAVIDGEPAYSSENQVGDFPVIIPAVDVTAIGAGGGSVAWVDAAGVLKVGPRSAGADPGPACYGRGGQEATTTDAYVHLGIIHPERFLGGAMPLDERLAAAVLTGLGERIGLDSRAPPKRSLTWRPPICTRSLRRSWPAKGSIPGTLRCWPTGEPVRPTHFCWPARWASGGCSFRLPPARCARPAAWSPTCATTSSARSIRRSSSCSPEKSARRYKA
ncbi:hypothetical protein HMSSN036_39830 [Paenibacillus macerans]|nr:hypothetical protein HMSSN036_39830 [Paenibacillus macerans]